MKTIEIKRALLMLAKFNGHDKLARRAAVELRALEAELVEQDTEITLLRQQSMTSRVFTATFP